MPSSTDSGRMVEVPSESSYGPLFERSSSIASLLKSAANTHRIRVLALAMRGEVEFSRMMEATTLSKTALSNHLGQLVDSGLMKRTARGKYELTPDGKDLLTAALSTYRRSKRHLDDEREMVRQGFGRAYGQIQRPAGRIISADAKYEPCWLSLLGAISGSLTAIGPRRTVVDVGGYTGYSFLVNVSKGETCPSGPTALHIKTFTEILEGVQCLGWRLRNFEYPHSYPSSPEGPTAEDLKVARKVFEMVRREIDNRARPVVLYGLVAPEYGIVRGYEGDSYIVSTFRSLQTGCADEDPVPHHELNAPGCIDAIFFDDRVKVRPSKARKEALARAIRFAEGDSDTLRNYVSGPLAFEEWARALEDVPEEAQNYMGNSYVGACVEEGRVISSAFLKAVSRKAPTSQTRHLSRAASSYAKGGRSLAEFTKMFPFRFEGKMPTTKRRKGARLLREAMSFEEKAISSLRKVA